MRQHEDRSVKRRVRPPPAPPFVVGADIGPRAGLRTELSPAHDLRTEPDLNPLGERMVDTDAASVIADHPAPEAGGEIPLVQPMAGVAEGGVERHALAGPEPVQGDREVVDTDLGHSCLLTIDSRTRRLARDPELGRSRRTDSLGGPFRRAESAGF